MRDELQDRIADVLAIIDGDTDKPIVPDRATRHALAHQVKKALAPELEKAKKLESICREFIERCDRGEVRSKYTYKRMKDALEGSVGDRGGGR